jgi:hypothetical protein
LKTIYFDTLQNSEVYGDLIQEEVPLEEPLFIVSTELPTTTKSLIISRVSDNERLLELSRSDNPPSVEIRTIETLSDEVIRVGWDSADTDGDSLNYNVYYAPDGAYESLVYHALTDSEEKLVDINLVDSNGAGPTEQAYVVVEASDGFNRAENRVLLNLGDKTDRIALKQYNTRGPNLPGMCSRYNCVKNKRHTLVASNPDSTVSVVADLRLRLVSMPDPACTVNGFLEGDELTVGSSILFNPGQSVREDVELEFICPTTVEPGEMSSFELEAYVWPLGSLDPISSNNSILKSQTVR